MSRSPSSHALGHALTRRRFLQAGALGLSLPGLFQARANAPARTTGRARACIFVYQIGGPAQHETWDPKPDAPAEYRGEFGVIATSVPSFRVSEHLPRLARLAHQFAVVRSCNHTDPEHNSASHAHLTGRMHPRQGQIVPPSPDDFPPYGAVLSRLRPSSRPVPNWVTMPDYLLNNSVPYPSQNAGFLGGACDPLAIRTDPNRPDFRLDGLTGDPALAARLAGRSALLGTVNRAGPGLAGSAGTQTMDACFERAFALFSSPQTREAFALSSEPPALRDRYGRTTWGQSLLLARRLVEAGVPLVTVNLANHGQAIWDTHGNNFSALKDSLLPRFDQAFSALLEDLQARGLLGETLVVAGGEFGRTPRINSGAGRDHWPWVYSTLYAGGGVRGGAVFGSSDRFGAHASSNPVSPGDLAATLYHCLGLDPATEIHDRIGRPFPIALGRPVTGILA